LERSIGFAVSFPTVTPTNSTFFRSRDPSTTRTLKHSMPFLSRIRTCSPNSLSHIQGNQPMHPRTWAMCASEPRRGARSARTNTRTLQRTGLCLTGFPVLSSPTTRTLDTLAHGVAQSDPWGHPCISSTTPSQLTTAMDNRDA
jgi:hypothetical protein